MGKGMTGNVVTIIISIVIAIIVLILLWIIFDDLIRVLSSGVADIMQSIKCSFCDKIGLFQKLSAMCKVCS
ncbi:hypothetical protein A3K63_01345 [Candidatus Micrarchaeota archaeon RBG_16_49_10]|nr:MAG: hypothetical protein A3K63_01345 [Candidatus Micrarchaeota archaeon RBG_16_49_10]